MNTEIIFLSGFLLLILLFLFIDLGVFSRKYHVISLRESLAWTLIWITLSMLFFLFIRYYGHLLHGIETPDQLVDRIARYHDHIPLEGLTFDQMLNVYNKNLSLQYITGYIIEYSLSLDNVFVMILIFLSFKVHQKYYKRVLFWGILGAIVMRFIFIFVLSALIHKAEWILYIFGIILLVTGAKMLWDFIKKIEKKIDVEHHPAVRFARRFFRIHTQYEEHKFTFRKNGKFYITPLFIVLLVIEFSDVVFAVDSVPAIFAVTRDPFIVFFSNVFAIMGLRSLFFLVSHIFNRFYYLKIGLSALLIFIGVKMLIVNFVKIPTQLSLAIIIGILFISIIASLFRKKPRTT